MDLAVPLERKAGRALAARVGAVVIGNALEFYDFLLYAFFAAEIGKSFFPGDSDRDSLLLVLATFGVGFLTRPLGGMMIGVMGDSRGRKPALLLSFGLMGIATTGLALTPSYASIGNAAPVLVILFRLLQGFALGGEVGPASAYMLEIAPVSQRGLYVSLQFVTQWGGGLAAGLVALLLRRSLDDASLTHWGWRVAFLIGAAVVPAGLWLRARLPETLPQGGHGEIAPAQGLIVLYGLMILAGATVATYMLSYLGIFGSYTMDLAADDTFGAAVVCGVLGCLFNPLGGALSDRFGRKPALIAGLVLLLLAVLPSFLAMVTWKTPLSLYVAAAAMAVPLSLATPAALAILLENLPARGRSGGAGIVYALAISLFGGTTQYVVGGLMDAADSALAPAWYLAAAVAVGLAGAALMPESAPVRAGGSRSRASDAAADIQAP